jgi:hypothetical protein
LRVRKFSLQSVPPLVLIDPEDHGNAFAHGAALRVPGEREQPVRFGIQGASAKETAE